MVSLLTGKDGIRRRNTDTKGPVDVPVAGVSVVWPLDFLKVDLLVECFRHFLLWLSFF